LRATIKSLQLSFIKGQTIRLMLNAQIYLSNSNDVHTYLQLRHICPRQFKSHNTVNQS
jgi:hypothetical protein